MLVPIEVCRLWLSMIYGVVLAANHLQAKGLEEYEATRLANLLAEKLNIREPAAVDVSR